MTTRGKKLLERDPDVIDAAFAHPLQLHVCALVQDLVRDLRTLERASDYYEFQRVLFSHVLRVQEAQALAARNVKRARSGKRVSDAPSGDWEIELVVADRAVRQLRAVGDALAWRLFNFDRRFILALSRNAPTGPMIDKAGLEYELGEVVTVWKRERCFALLHDLTSALRIADLTKFTRERPELVEVKKRPGRIPAAQFRRIQGAIDAINHEALLPGEDGDTSLFVSRQQLKTHLKTLGDGLAIADREGMSSIRLGHQWVVSCVACTSPKFPKGFAAGLAEWERRRTRSFAKAGLPNVQHHLRGVGVDEATANPASAPFTIFPFEPDVCARLTCDLLLYESTIAWDRLSQAFEAEGFATQCPLPSKHEKIRSGQAVLIASRGKRTVTIHAGGLAQVLFEMVDPRRYAAVVREIVDRPVPWGSGVFTFANERAIWR